MDDNQAIPDDLDALERKYLARSAFDHPDTDEENDVDFNSDFSVDEEHENMEEEEMFSEANGVIIEDDSDWSKVLSTHRPKNNTGGKGVLADYAEARKITRRRNETKALQQREGWKKRGNAADRFETVKPQEQRNKDSDDEEEDDEEEDEFLKEFRARRVQEIAAASGLPQFGTLRSVTPHEFVDEVEHADPRTVVVTHLYEDYLLVCQRMNHILSVLAGRYPHIKFLKLRATEADQTLSHSALPAFLVYRANRLLGPAAVSMNKTEFQNEKFTEDDVEWFLAAKYKIPLPGVDVSDQERRRRKLEVQQEEDIRSSVVKDASGSFRKLQ